MRAPVGSRAIPEARIERLDYRTIVTGVVVLDAPLVTVTR